MTPEEAYREIKSRIVKGELKAGLPCPSEAKLALEFCMARETMRGVIRRLAQERFLSPVRRGLPRIIQSPEILVLPKIRPSESSSFGDFLETGNWNPHDVILHHPERAPLRSLDHARLHASEIASHLKLDLDTEVQWLGRVRLAGASPVAIQWVIVPASLIGSLEPADLHPGGLTHAYHERYGLVRLEVDAHYRATPSTFEEARQLKIAQGSPLIEERRVSLGQLRAAGRRKLPYEYLLSLYPDSVALNFRWKTSELHPSSHDRRSGRRHS